jgi:hypothetical protein
MRQLVYYGVSSEFEPLQAGDWIGWVRLDADEDSYHGYTVQG